MYYREKKSVDLGLEMMVVCQHTLMPSGESLKIGFLPKMYKSILKE